MSADIAGSLGFLGGLLTALLIFGALTYWGKR